MQPLTFGGDYRVTSLGAHHVIDHAKPIAEQVEALDLGSPAFVFSTMESHRHPPDIAALIAPQGRLGLIDDPETFDIMEFKQKAVSVHLEMIFTRSLFGTPDMAAQGRMLDEVARLVDSGQIRTTLNTILSPINAATLKQAHVMIETGQTQGKIVIEGF